MAIDALSDAHSLFQAHLAGHLDRVHGDEPGLVSWQ